MPPPGGKDKAAEERFANFMTSTAGGTQGSSSYSGGTGQSGGPGGMTFGEAADAGIMSQQDAVVAQAQQNFLNQAANLRRTGYGDQMRYQREDTTDNLNRAIAMNQGNLGFGRLRKDVAGADIANQFNLSDRFGSYGLNQQGQQNMADMYGYNEFQRQENWAPEMMQNYFGGVSQTPWETSQTSTQTGQGPSMFDKALGLGLAGAGAAGGMGWKPFAK